MKVLSFNDIKDINEIAYTFLTTNNLKELPLGRYDFCDEIYCNVEEYDSMPRHLYEAHRKYIDIQIVVTGKEKIIVRDIDLLKSNCEFDEEKDFIKYDNDDLGEEYTLNENECLLLYPKQGHMPRVMIDKPMHIKKIVFKIPVEK